MSPPAFTHSSWSTASSGEATDTSPMELSALSEHFDHCQGARGRLFSMRCAADALDVFLSARVVTTLAAATALIGFCTLLA